MGRGIEGRRDQVFLMTKNCERDYQGSLKCLDDSLRRQRTDHLDLWQFHEMVYDNDPDGVFEKGGIKAALEAQQAGKVRFIGFTGRKDPHTHLKMLDKDQHWDTAQMPINICDWHFRSFQQTVVPVCLDKGTGVMKRGNAAEATDAACKTTVSSQPPGGCGRVVHETGTLRRRRSNRLPAARNRGRPDLRRRPESRPASARSG